MNNVVTPSPIVAKKLCAEASYGYCGVVAPGVEQVLAKNPKDYTGPGTNTYIVGDEGVWIIDPGPDCQEHIDTVLGAVARRPVAGILVTHSHLDHSMAAVPITINSFINVGITRTKPLPNARVADSRPLA